ncbi:MAG: class I SAM-dependent DNA methyltransferase [Candidatus Afipia apatlaquensis]|uniref:site-specific DNA-methyltransferase (adenine-specific) n=1 Tax=Candidatus Afipia apatlaquensis TaxID=2712852 RepID=A0A7C9VG02_9BRAD|nr:class I SAM-dependent DNA methyltransferase [Candidatus Afipia apatlaquensis]
MKATDIEEAISQLAAEPFNAAEFPYRLLEAFGNKETTLKRLRSGTSNASDVEGGLLQRSNIHLAVCGAGAVSQTLQKLKSSSATLKAKAKFVLATDGDMLEVEELATGEAKICKFVDLPKAFGLMLPLAGISAVRQIKDNPIDIRATNKLNKLYVELLKENPDWDGDARRADLNQFMARLIFCFFAESTGIFNGDHLFTKAIEQFTASDSSNTHEVIAELFRAMDTKIEDRAKAKVRPFAEGFPYVNGGLFTKRNEVPRFSRIARSYLVNAGALTWREINPDIFGSMIQAVADEDERGELGMHYTSVPNILKVLNPLFLDDLREKLEEAGDNRRKLQNLRKRLARIRVFDPACGSGNFLVIAYRQMREIERRIIIRLQGGADTVDNIVDVVNWPGERSAIQLTNFFGIEIKSFAAEIARLALLIAEFQCDVNYIGQKEARDMVLPLHDTGRVKTGNALRENWLEVCPPPKPTSAIEEDLGGPTGRLALDVSGEPDVETYVCGNPPYKGSQDQTAIQKEDLRIAFDGLDISPKSADYVWGWFVKGRAYLERAPSSIAFVTTNSIHQGRQVGRFWPAILRHEMEILFAVPSFRWSNLASNKAAVTVSVIGLSRKSTRTKMIFAGGLAQEVKLIGPYLVPNHTTVVDERRHPLSQVSPMVFGSMPNDGKKLLMSFDEAEEAVEVHGVPSDWVRPLLGTRELTKGIERRCLWLKNVDVDAARRNEWLAGRIDAVADVRRNSDRATTRKLAATPHLFGEIRQDGNERVVLVGGVSSEFREFLPAQYFDRGTLASNLAFAICNAPIWNLSLILSRLHLVWIATVCGKMKTDFRYSNTLGWNTFPVPPLTTNQKAELTRCAEDILLAREAHFPAAIADLYDPEGMPDNLRAAHDKNDDTLERIYIGRRFKTDTERLEKLFDMYTKMTAKAEGGAKPKKAKRGAA